MLSIYSCYPSERKLHPIIIYGHSTHGIPGLEISGLGSRGKLMKEKIIFLTKKCGFRAPLKRYILCLDIDKAPRDCQDFSWCELPLLLLYWSLAKLTPRFNPTDAMLAGSITPHGVILLKEIWKDREHLIEETYLLYRTTPRFVLSDMEWQKAEIDDESEREDLGLPLSALLPASPLLVLLPDKTNNYGRISSG